jgi:hypothetical protein
MKIELAFVFTSFDGVLQLHVHTLFCTRSVNILSTLYILLLVSLGFAVSLFAWLSLVWYAEQERVDETQKGLRASVARNVLGLRSPWETCEDSS